MFRTVVGTAVALGLASTVALLAARSNAAAFVAWKVTNVPFGDVLNVRKYPSTTSQKQAAYPNGTVLSMTGRCTGGLDLFAIAGLPAAQQEQLVRYQWCEVWHDPAQNGKYMTGWVYGKYTKPA